jgi:hypothetical protein
VVVAVDIETETRWPGSGPRMEYGLTYPADVTVIALAWSEGDAIATTVLAAPFDADVRSFLRTLFNQNRLIVAHNAVFDMRQLSKLTDGQIPQHIWDTQSMARLMSPAVDASYSLLAVARSLNIPVPERQQAMKRQRGRLHALPLELTLEYAQDDARLALEIYLRQRQIPFDEALINWECRAVREYCIMAAHGIRLNTPFVERRLKTLEQEREVIASRLRADGLATPRSAKARVRYLYETKGLPLPEWNPRSRYFTRGGRRRLSANPDSPVEISDLSTSAYVLESYL